MKVAINGRFLSQRVTGVQRHAGQLVRALDRRLQYEPGAGPRLDVTLFAPPDAVCDLDLAHIRARRVGRLRGQAWEQLELPRHARGNLLLNLANTAPILFRHQIVTIHDASVFAVPDAYSPAFRHFYRWLQPHLAQQAERVLTDSEFSRAELVRWMGAAEERVTVVPCGHEHVLAVPADRTIFTRHRLGIRPYVLAVSSLARHKNLAAVLAAAHLLRDHGWDFVAAGPVNPRIFEPVPAGVAAPLSQLGYVTDAELRALYEGAACFVYPSRYEGFGLPPLEAMACGCPVIVSGSASLPEVCGDAALYVDPDDPEELAAAIRRVLCEDGLADQLRRRSREQVKRWTWEGAADKALVAIREVLAS